MGNASMAEPAGATRRGIALAAVGAALTAAVAFAPDVLAAETPLLQVSYSTDPYMTCDALQEEVARMDLIVAARGASAALVKTARERQQKLGEILKTKSCGPKPAKVFGPDMYDLPGTAPGRR
jgi:hypothetical protein